MVDKLSEGEIAEFKDAFGLFDTNKDGFINITELKCALIQLGNNPSDADVRRMIDELDTDGDGSINFPEFLVMMSKNWKKSRKDTAHELQEAFNVFDKDRDGFITHDEMKLALHTMGEQITDKEIEEMIEEADTDGDGKVSFHEFISMMKSKEVT